MMPKEPGPVWQRLFGAAVTAPIFLLALLAAGCATTAGRPDFSQDEEAREIYRDLVESGFVAEQQAKDYGTGMSAIESAIIRFLGRLAGSESESERDTAREGLSRRLAPLGFSAVCFRTPAAGATVRYRALHLNSPEYGPQTNQDAAHPMPLGIYHIWTERGGQATSSPENRYKVTRRSQRIDLEVERGDTSDLADCDDG